jgi:translation initiation factor 4E
MLAAIGETFETPYNPQGTLPSADYPNQDQLTGVIVSSRKTFYRINIWTRASDTRNKVEDIGKHFKYGVLGFNQNAKSGAGMEKLASDVEFVSHEASQSRNKSKGWTV